MFIVLKTDASQDDIDNILNYVENLGFLPTISQDSGKKVINLNSDNRLINRDQFSNFQCVESVVTFLTTYKLVNRNTHPEDTIIEIDDIKIGGKNIVLIAGPCTVENEEQMFASAEIVKKVGVKILRGGAYKPRTSPYTFQGLGEEGLKILGKVKKQTGLKIITEVMDDSEINIVSEYADILQIGSRNMQNTKLLKAVSKVNKPVLLKRGFAATLSEFLMSAEYILSGGNERVILCERGIRTFVEYTRNTLDLNIIPAVKQFSHLPIIVDPSHGTGRYEFVLPMSRAAIAAGADGLIVEVHPNPELAISDGQQSLKPEKFFTLVKEIRSVAEAIGRTII